jgi:bifunctional UDP-N-acetylglucosamine pyrophosphorylase/glucosamine-1-phosphate N-acetyltransferase
VTGSEIGESATVGPFSYIRAGTEMGESSKIGAYTETKALKLGARSKIPHLSYAGDAEIGEGTNFGCGSIIANYDGVHKHKTRVGSNGRIGSNTIFVAPVEVGNNVYTGAGSVVRKNVPDGALVYSENDLTIKEGWTEENR